jgi:IS1 family transposase
MSEIIAWVFGKRDYKTAKKLRGKITKLHLKFWCDCYWLLKFVFLIT